MNIYQWMVYDSPEDFTDEQEARKFFKAHLTEFDQKNPVHWGDCTKIPMSCFICYVADIITRYGDWCSHHRFEVYNTIKQQP